MSIGRLRGVDHMVVFLNLMLLMSSVVLRFSTNLMATYLRASQGEHLAADVYGDSLLLMGVLFSAHHHIVAVRPS